MGITTIQLSNEMKKKISAFGNKGETYEQILERMYALAFRENLRKFMMSSEGFISLDEFEKEVKKKWPK
ncbi:hypothetical protein HYS72_01115, partial [Candidatus Pacearchaeota archaeon]|nr:hypothetical protein [Candidatus Pacearchaeota archaeon]